MAVASKQDEMAKHARHHKGCARECTLKDAFESLLDNVREVVRERMQAGNFNLVAGLEVSVSSGRGAKGTGQDIATFFAETAHTAVVKESEFEQQIIDLLRGIHFNDESQGVTLVGGGVCVCVRGVCVCVCVCVCVYIAHIYGANNG